MIDLVPYLRRLEVTDAGDTRAIELVDEKVTILTDYLVNRIDGEPSARRADRHALPGPYGG
jgi:hypothetical protein